MERKCKSLRMNRWMIVILLVVVLFDFFKFPIKGAEPEITTKDRIPFSYNVVDDKGYNAWGEYMEYIYADGKIAFCVQPGVLVQSGSSYTTQEYSAAQKMQMERIAYVGWHLSDQSDEDYLTTQLMIWELLGTTINSTSYSSYETKKKTINKKVEEIFGSIPSFAEKEYTIDVGKSITLNDENGVFSNYHLVSKSKGVTVAKNGNKVTISVSEDAPKHAVVTYQLVREECAGTSILYNAESSQDVVAFKVEDSKEIQIDLQVNTYGAMQIKKVDEDGKTIADTSFKISLHADMHDAIGTFTTGRDGTITIEDLLPGTYYVQEVSVPSHLVLDPTIHQVVVQADQTTAYTAQNNWKKGKVLLRKTDKDSGKQVAGAIYAIYDANNDQEVARLTSVADGYASSGYLRFGKYYVKEVIAPDGYVLSDTKYPVTISENEQMIEVNGVDERVRGTIRIEKQDSQTGKKAQGEATLADAIYGLYAKENIVDPADHTIVYHAGELVSKLTINSEHKASISDLYLGSYYLKEMQASEGYTLNEKEYPIELSYQGQTEAIVHIDQVVEERVQSQAFQIIKLSNNGNGQSDLLAGVEFTIKAQADIDRCGSWEAAPIAKNAMGETAAVLVTNEEGYAISEELPYGTYVVRETKVPNDHYAIPDFIVEIKEDSRTPQPWRVFNDEKFRAVIAIEKLDADTGKRVQIAGTTFKIRDLSNNQYVGYWESFPFPHYVDCWTTTQEGIVVSGDLLDAGEYQIEEIKAPNGYVLKTKPVKFKVSSNAAYETLPDGITPVITVKMSDQAVKGRIKIEKRGEVLVDFKDGQFVYEERGIEGMIAEVVASEDILDPSNDGTAIYSAGTVVDTITTDQDGKGLSKELPLGKYEVHEVKAPAGYVLREEIRYVELTYDDQEAAVVFSDLQTFMNDRQKVNLSIQKLDAETKTPIQGAEFSLNANRKVYNYDGEVILEPNALIATAVSDENGMVSFAVDLPIDLTPEDIIDLLDEDEDSVRLSEGFENAGDPNALWYVQETKAAKGYVNEVTVHHLFDTEFTDQKQDIQWIAFELYNDQTTVEISKTDLSGETELEGAHLQVLDTSGQLIDEWISDGSAHRIKGLTVNETYQLIETIAPEGYSIANPIEFTVKDTAEVQTVQMKDDLTHIAIAKVNEEGEPLADCVLVLLDAQGTIIEQWTTSTQEHPIDGLTGGASYTLREIRSAKGYGLAKDIVFQVPEKQGEICNITMKNYPLTDLSIIKKDARTKQRILTSDYAFSLYSEEDCKELLQTVYAQNGELLFEDLPLGTYYIKETIAPKGYVCSKEIRKVIIDEQTCRKDAPYEIFFVNEPIVEKVKTAAISSWCIWSTLSICMGSLFVWIGVKKRKK